ncbi:hypothetical protein PISL3812_03616 [Talaromyces islandicus]|uniref:Zn(2)-C6 fungal-type domain-containing protein n=1 Tax=Talaromyces islandicus TaxID=28573 RepID=A0A0U1LUY4_TALIS|nr:hypothetical protein PISL3812_03616 [Talaromyces islandicus]
MQSLLLPAPWFSNSHFGPHRFDFDPGRIPIHSRPPSTGPKPSLRADQPPPPMSGLLPTSTQSDGAVTTQQQRPAGPERPTSIDVSRTNLPPTLPTLSSIGAASVSQAPRFVSPLQTGGSGSSAIQIPSIHTGLSRVFTEPPQAYGLPASSSLRSLPPRSTRRAKAHVASACVNCKRKHLGCDSARPCRRCVLSGKASTCVDVTHKKRGRPPLKAEEAPVRTFAPAEGSVISGEQFQISTARGHGHSRTSSREIRPITDLQYARPRGHSTAGSSVGAENIPSHPPRWQPGGQGPLTSPAPAPPPLYAGVNYPSSPFTRSPVTAFANPAPSSELRSLLMYNDRPPVITPPTVSPQQYHQHYAAPLQSHISPQTPNRPGDTTGPPLDLQEPSRDLGIRLPPILPSPTAFTHGSPAHSHQRSGSYSDISGYQGPKSPRQVSQVQALPQESPRSFFDPSSRVELRSPFPPMPRPRTMMSGLDQKSPLSQAQHLQRGLGTETEPELERGRKIEADREDNPQPTKRRRMAVDDIVND